MVTMGAGGEQRRCDCQGMVALGTCDREPLIVVTDAKLNLYGFIERAVAIQV